MRYCLKCINQQKQKLRVISILIISSLLFLPGCTSELVLRDLPLTISMFDIQNMPTQSTYPEAEAVILVNQTDNQTLLENSKLITQVTHHVVKKVFRNGSDESIVNIVVGEDEELLGIKARTIRVDGKIIDVQPKDIYTISGYAESSLLFANVQTYRFTFPSTEKDCIVEYIYRIKQNRPFVNDTWIIQNNLPTLRNQYTVTMPFIMSAILPFRYRAFPQSVEMKPMVVMNRSDYTTFYSNPVTYIWARGDVPAFKPEAHMPPPETYRAHVRFSLSTWGSWNDIGEWYYTEFFSPQMILTDSIKSLAKEITKDCASDSGKIKRVYNYVQKIRYIAIQLGESGLRPSKPQEIIRNNYGDCKDKSILTIALLKSLGIEAYPVLIQTADRGRIDISYPSWNFNHMIVKASDNKKAYWMDPTSEFSPFGVLPWVDQNIPSLTMMDTLKAVMETTPGSLASNNCVDVALYVDVTHSGKAVVRGTVKSTGEIASAFRSMFYEKGYEEIKDNCKNIIQSDVAQQYIDTVIISNMQNVDTTFVIDINYSLPNTYQTQGDITLFNSSMFKIDSDMSWLGKGKRKYPIWYPYASTIRKKSVVRFNDTTRVIHSFPDPVSIANKYMSFDKSFKRTSESTIFISETISNKAVEIPATEYSVVSDFYENMRSSGNSMIVCKKKK